MVIRGFDLDTVNDLEVSPREDGTVFIGFSVPSDGWYSIFIQPHEEDHADAMSLMPS